MTQGTKHDFQGTNQQVEGTNQQLEGTNFCDLLLDIYIWRCITGCIETKVEWSGGADSSGIKVGT